MLQPKVIEPIGFNEKHKTQNNEMNLFKNQGGLLLKSH